MANHAGAEFILPVHHQTFRLKREPLHEPIERLLHSRRSGCRDRDLPPRDRRRNSTWLAP